MKVEEEVAVSFRSLSRCEGNGEQIHLVLFFFDVVDNFVFVVSQNVHVVKQLGKSISLRSFGKAKHIDAERRNGTKTKYLIDGVEEQLLSNLLELGDCVNSVVLQD